MNKLAVAASQRVLLPMLLAALYFIVFGLFAPVGRWTARKLAREAKVSEGSEWHVVGEPKLAELERQS